MKQTPLWIFWLMIIFTTSPFPLCFICPSTTLTLIHTAVKADSHSHFLLDNFTHLSILGCGNSHPCTMTKPPPPTVQTFSPLLSFSHFLQKPFSLQHPLSLFFHSSSPWGSFESAEPWVRMFHHVTQINVSSPPWLRGRAAQWLPLEAQSSDVEGLEEK